MIHACNVVERGLGWGADAVLFLQDRSLSLVADLARVISPSSVQNALVCALRFG